MLPDPPKKGPCADDSAEAPKDGFLVACLCAEWCTACRAYRAVFDQAAVEHPELRFLWIDIEDSEALLDQVEVENFPTVLIGDGKTVRFFGAIMPQRDVLRRLIAAHRPGACDRGAVSPEISGLLSKLQDVAE